MSESDVDVPNFTVRYSRMMLGGIVGLEATAHVC
jgi:hypothetical protein